MKVSKFVFIMLILLFGCKSKQKLSPNLYPNCKYGNYTKSDLELKLDSSSMDFSWMKIKTKVDVEFENKNNSFQLQLRIKNDSLVFAKISKSGIAGIRILTTKDSVFYVDKLNKQYYEGVYSDIEKLINISIPFQFLQNLFLGEPTFLYEDDGQKKVVEPFIEYSSNVFNQAEKYSAFYQIQSFTCDSLKLRKVGFKDWKTKKEIEVNYQKKSDINGYSLNKKIELKGSQENKPFILANIELKRVKTFNDLTAPLEIPDDYTKMEIK